VVVLVPSHGCHRTWIRTISEQVDIYEYKGGVLWRTDGWKSSGGKDAEAQRAAMDD
jgi:hypothetical protein